MRSAIITASACIAAITTVADGQVWPHVDGSMKHVLISLENQAIDVHVDGEPTEPMEMLRYPGEQYHAPADVLDETYYSSRYGWLAGSFIDLPQDAGIFVRMLNADTGLDVYEGGMRMMLESHTYAPILGTAGSSDIWQWGGTMVHNWYAASSAGEYTATYEVYVGDASTGTPLANYTPDVVTLYFGTVPAPGGTAALGIAGLVATRRRRGVC